MKESTKESLFALLSVLLSLGAIAYLIIANIVHLSYTGSLGMGILDWVIFVVMAGVGKTLLAKAKTETEANEADMVTVEAEAEVEPEAPISASVPAPAPESIVITCEKCGQQMLIPVGSGTVKITCPKCGSDIIHTYGN